MRGEGAGIERKSKRRLEEPYVDVVGVDRRVTRAAEDQIVHHLKQNT